MKRILTPLALCAAALALAAAPASAANFSIFGSYWDTADVGGTGGGGIELAFPIAGAFGLELRGTYYQELSDAPVDALFDNNDPVFRKVGIQAIPAEVGARFTFPVAGGSWEPWVSAGASYMFLDVSNSTVKVDDETGWYASLGSRFGNPDGLGFMAEVLYRNSRATVKRDPNSVDDLDDIHLRDRARIDLDGAAVNAGINWRF